MPKKAIDRRKTDEIILERVDALAADVKRLILCEAGRIEREETQTKLIRSHEEAIKGNGKPGLQTDMQIMKDNISRINWAFAVFTAAIIADIASRIIK
jgi:hypothetical protein